MAIFSKKGNFPSILYTAFTKVLIKQKVAIIERHMTPIWKEERWGYNIYQNEQNQFFGGWTPPYTLKDTTIKWNLGISNFNPFKTHILK